MVDTSMPGMEGSWGVRVMKGPQDASPRYQMNQACAGMSIIYWN